MCVQALRVSLIALSWIGLWSVALPSNLPELPRLNLSGFLPAIRRQVQQADAAARAKPEDARAVGNLGMVLDAYQQDESAALCYERAWQLDPRAFRWAYYLGSVQFHQGRYDAAIATLRRALLLSPNYPPARLKLAESFLADGKLGESEKTYETILQDAPKPMDSRFRGNDGDGEIASTAEALYGLGRIQAARGETSTAAKSFRKACELFPAFGAAQYALALAYQKLGAPEKAQPHFTAYQANMTVTPPLDDPLLAAVQALNMGVEAHLDRGVALEKQGRLNEAIAEQEQALAIDPEDVQAYINLISLEARAGHPEKAEEQFQMAARLDPNRADAYYNHGVLLNQAGNFSQAEQAYRKALQINPNYAEAHNNLGYLLEMQNRAEDALAEYEAALKARPNYRLPHYHIASILARQGEYDEAIQHLLKTLAPEDASTPAYLYALGIAYGRKGDRVSALKYLRLARDRAAARHQSQLLAEIDRLLDGQEQAREPQ